MSLRAHVDVNYNQLKSYSGITVQEPPQEGKGGGNFHHFMRLEKHMKDNG